MANEKFNQLIADQTGRVTREDQGGGNRSWSLSLSFNSRPPLSAATKAFIEAINKNTSDSAHAYAIALFQFCISRNPQETHELYNTLIQKIFAQHIKNNINDSFLGDEEDEKETEQDLSIYFIEHSEQEIFFSQLLAVLQKMTPPVPHAPQLINDILKLTDYLLSSFPEKEAKKAQLLIDSGFIRNHFLPHVDLKQLPELNENLKSKFLSLAYTDARKEIQQINMIRMENSTYMHVEQLIITLNIQQINTTNQTFNPKTWYGFLRSTKKTLLQHLSWQALCDARPTAEIVADIRIVLACHVSLENEDQENQGYWIETLLVSMYNKKNADRMIIAGLLQSIPQPMWQVFWEQGLVQKILTTLMREMNVYADSASDQSIYALYFRFILEAILQYPEKALALDGLIRDLCGLLLHQPQETQRYFIDRYNFLPDSSPLKQYIKENITTFTENSVVLSTIRSDFNISMNLPKFIWSDDAELKFIRQICMAMKEALFLPQNSINSIGTLNSNNLITLSSAQTASLYASIQKSIAYSFSYGRYKWQSYVFITGYLGLLAKLAQTFEFDSKSFLPENHDIILDNYYWAVTYQNQKDKLPDHFGFIQANAQQRWKGFLDACTITDHVRDTFVSTIIKNSASYTKSSFMSKKNEQCAATLAALKYEGGDTASKNKIFIKAVIIIIHYRLSCYYKESNKVEKGFYVNELKPSLLALHLNRNDVQLSPAYKEKLSCEITTAVAEIGVLASSNHTSLIETLSLFNDIFQLGLSLKFEAGVPRLQKAIPAIMETPLANLMVNDLHTGSSNQAASDSNLATNSNNKAPISEYRT